MAIFSWRSCVWSTVVAGSLVSALAQEAPAGCLTLLAGSLWGDCCGGSYGAGYGGSNYGGYMSAYGYSGSNYGYYTPSYSSYGPAYGGCNGCAPSYGYATAAVGCAPCVGSGCGISNPDVDPTRPKPDDKFRELPEKDPISRDPIYQDRLDRDRTDRDRMERDRRAREPNNNDPDERPLRRRGEVTDPPTTPIIPRLKSNLRGDGFIDPSDRSMEDADPNSDLNKKTFEKPLESKSKGDPIDPFGQDAKKLPMPNDTLPKDEKKKPIEAPDDAFPVEEENSTKATVEKPVLGEPSDTDAPADANSPHGTVIPQAKPAPPLEIPAEEVEEIKEADPMPNVPDDLKELDEKPTSAGVAPKIRLVLKGRFGTPSIVRLKVRPNPGWDATPVAPVLAKH